MGGGLQKKEVLGTMGSSFSKSGKELEEEMIQKIRGPLQRRGLRAFFHDKLGGWGAERGTLFLGGAGIVLTMGAGWENAKKEKKKRKISTALEKIKGVSCTKSRGGGKTRAGILHKRISTSQDQEQQTGKGHRLHKVL